MLFCRHCKGRKSEFQSDRGRERGREQIQVNVIDESVSASYQVNRKSQVRVSDRFIDKVAIQVAVDTQSKCISCVYTFFCDFTVMS